MGSLSCPHPAEQLAISLARLLAEERPDDAHRLRAAVSVPTVHLLDAALRSLAALAGMLAEVVDATPAGVLQQMVDERAVCGCPATDGRAR